MIPQNNHLYALWNKWYLIVENQCQCFLQPFLVMPPSIYLAIVMSSFLFVCYVKNHGLQYLDCWDWTPELHQIAYHVSL